MSELISGKEAKLAWANGVAVQVDIGGGVFGDITGDDLLSVFDYATNRFRIKPRTITINNMEVPAPFEPKYGDTAFVLSKGYKGYKKVIYRASTYSVFGAYRTEEEIKQVVSALRSIFK